MKEGNNFSNSFIYDKINDYDDEFENEEDKEIN